MKTRDEESEDDGEGDEANGEDKQSMLRLFFTGTEDEVMSS